MSLLREIIMLRKECKWKGEAGFCDGGRICDSARQGLARSIFVFKASGASGRMVKLTDRTE